MSKFVPNECINTSNKMGNWKNWVELSDVRKALDDIETYMSTTFPNLKWVINRIIPIDFPWDKRGHVSIVIFTNSVDREFESLEFYYVIEEKILIPYHECHIIYLLKNQMFVWDNDTNECIARNKVFFAIYNENDREDGNPLYQTITYEMINNVKDIPSLLAFAGTYSGNGCVEVRVESEDGEEDTYIYSDNNGYKILTDTEL